MTEPQTTPPPPREGHALDTLGSKVFFSLICFLSPAPLAIVIADFWLRFQGKLAENAINPLFFIRQGVTSLHFATAWPLLLALLPPAVTLAIVFRDLKSRAIMIALLLVAAVLQFIVLAQLSSI